MDAEASGPFSITRCREQLERWQQRQASQFQAGKSSEQLVQANATWMDHLLTQLWDEAGLAHEPELALIAVGGYGRSELHPGSDIDLLILTGSELSPELEQQISQLVTWLWDIRLTVGQSVRTLAQTQELARSDITIATNLLESRLICGAAALFSQLSHLLTHQPPWQDAAFFRAKTEERDQRLARYHGTAYNLEPNIKGNPGGLRDIQLIGWISCQLTGSNRLNHLVEAGMLEHAEHEQLLEHRAFLWRLRYALHLHTGRGEDRLLFDHQASVARLLGFDHEHDKQAVEAMMHQYYRCSLEVRELVEMLLDLFAERLLDEEKSCTIRLLDDDFQRRGDQIEARHEGVYEQHEKLLQLLLHVADDSKIRAIAPQTLRRLRLMRNTLQQPLVEDPACRELFMALIRHRRGLSRPMQLMHQHGVLGAYLPAWHKIVGQMQFDLFHAYTVDEHTFRLLNNLHRFSRTKYQDEFPLCSAIVTRLRRPERLFLAGLFHDIGKGRGGDHSQLGAIDAEQFCLQHGMSERDSRMVAWLVRNHLLMSVTAQRRDISDPDVVHEFATTVRDERHLDLLYCLTVADIRATNSSLWNNWKDSLLRELYFATQRALRRGLENPVDMSEQICEARTAAARLLDSRQLSEADYLPLWEQLHEDYFLRHAPEQIAWQTEQILAHQQSEEAGKPLVRFARSLRHGCSELFICTQDQPNLFARIVSALDLKQLSIQDAQIISSDQGVCLDTFLITNSSGMPVVAPSHQLAIRKQLTAALSDPEGTITRPPRRMARQLRQFSVKTSLEFLPSNRDDRTLLELVSLDQPGLLAKVGKALQHCALQVHSAKIATFGEKAEDFFILSTSQGTALDEPLKQQLKQILTSLLSQAGNSDNKQ